MIELKNIQKRFGDITIIDNVSAVMKSGQCNLIIGASGSGKTVLMKCMVGLFEPDSGEILYSGVNFTELNNEQKTEIRKEIGMLFQGSALFDSQTVEQNIMFPLDMFAKW
ncbi:MAG TPA: ATP-binding cassette domain-containing protein, partial [Chitinophagaceae bacterium]|nr:ATP-binding cassette domain-containing protein [Chitinophagaceae bacterium]